MKKYLSILALCVGLSGIANAVPIVVNLTAPPVGDIPKNGTGPAGQPNANNAASNFFRLQTFIAANPDSLCTPIFDGHLRFEELEPGSGNPAVDVTGFDYAVIHYGVGSGGVRGSGGGIEFFSISGDGLFQFPDFGSGPNGFGGISSLDLFKCDGNHVPDGGATVALLGAALGAIGLARRKFSV